jgi:outer membrane receptor protein involved in Fe transport
MKPAASLRQLLAGCTAAIGCAELFADGGSAFTNELVALQDFEVRADRVPAADNSAIEERRLALPEPFTGVTREEFGRRANRRAGDIVARLSGIFMGGPPGENKDVRGRGLDKEFTRAQVDGLALPDGGEKRELQLNRVPADLIQEIRVLRNPSPEFESDGLATRLDFRFRQIPERPLFIEARGAGGERSDVDDTRWVGSLTAGGRPRPDLGWLLSFNYLDDPTYKVKTEDTFSATGVRTKAVPEREDKPSLARDLYADAAWYYAHGEIHLKPLRLDLREPKHKTKTTFDLTKAATADETVETEDENKSKLGEGLSLIHRHDFDTTDNSAGALDTQLSWQRARERHDTPKTTTAYKETAGNLVLNTVTTETENKTDDTLSLDTRYSYSFANGAHFVKFGFATRARERERVKQKLQTTAAGVTTDTTGPKDNYSMDEDYHAFFAQDTWHPTPRLHILAGARVETVDFTSRTPTSTDAEHTFRDINPNAQFLFRLREDTSLKFAVSRAVNRPKFDELSPYEQNDGKKVTLGNPDLRPARAWKADLGVEHRRTDVFLAANVFASDIAGVIESVQTGELLHGLPVTQTLNVGNGTLLGLELEQRVGFRWSRLAALAGLTLWSNQTLIDSRLREYSGAVRRFSGQPRFLGHVGLDYEIRRLYVTASVQHVGRRPGDEASADRKEQFAETTVDAALHFRLGGGVTLFAEANNLTGAYKDERTWKADGTSVRKIERTGRAWFAGARYTF